MGTSTLAHELVLKEETLVGNFFAAYAIQWYLSDFILKNKIKSPNFIKNNYDVTLSATQRIFIKQIISNKSYNHIHEEISAIFEEYSKHYQQNPGDIFLSKINKNFLIRQIFEHTEQTLSKYSFIKNYLHINIADINKNIIDTLLNDIIVFPIEQQILILIRVFSTINDNHTDKYKRTIDSFSENLLKIKNRYIAKNKKNSQEFINLEIMQNSLLNKIQ